MTPFTALAKLAGLSHKEAAEFHGVREQQCKDMSSGRRSTPPGIIAELLQLIGRQEAAAKLAQSEADSRGSDVITLERPADDVEAKALGWPCVGAWGAMVARVIAASPHPVAFVPYGAAADAASETPLPRL
ncbi:hypothetical protein [Methylosinus sp. KRF6]|uniref:hypothetical protein n=1 Tax=Methylosinus sp. KRF6 TaxID=2846853 RepID=UPI001C0BE2B2|nr:hypothetical protein [Methylosinus sp. KRF6]MBU3890103.1 hypothetical protein [Methylosinus sp. KRF6]